VTFFDLVDYVPRDQLPDDVIWIGPSGVHHSFLDCAFLAYATASAITTGVFAVLPDDGHCFDLVLMRHSGRSPACMRTHVRRAPIGIRCRTEISRSYRAAFTGDSWRMVLQCHAIRAPTQNGIGQSSLLGDPSPASCVNLAILASIIFLRQYDGTAVTVSRLGFGLAIQAYTRSCAPSGPLLCRRDQRRREAARAQASRGRLCPESVLVVVGSHAAKQCSP
jgi:hypothetical protein